MAVARSIVIPSSGLLLGCHDQADEIGTRRIPGPRFEDHNLALDRQEPHQRPNGKGVSHEHERARPAPIQLSVRR